MTSWRGADRESLRKMVMSPTALVPMILRHPQPAAELVLAALLREPAVQGHIGLEPDFGITSRIDAQPPLPENGPMIGFFTHAAEVATPTLLKIVDHATAAWAESEMATVEDEDIGSVFEILLDGEWVTLTGNSNVMHWHRGDARVPRALASGLMGLEQYLYRRLAGQIETGPPLDELFAELTMARSVAIFGVLVEAACYQPDLLEGLLAPLATSAGLILADRLYKAHDHPYLRMSFSDFERRRLDMWHEMEHRSRTLDQAVMPLAVGDGLLADQLATARGRWAKDPEDRWRFLVAQMDPASYERIDLDTGGHGWVFRLPPHLQQEIDVDQNDLATRQWWLTAPRQLARWVQAAAPATDEEAQHLWDQVQQRLAETPPADVFEDGLLHRADVECGTAAALLICARSWVEERPVVGAFCREALTRPFREPPPIHMFDSPGETVDHTWDGFAALALPVLWESDPQNADLRHCAGRLATHRHLETVRRFFASVEHWPSLETDGRRLETLSLYWARYLTWLSERRRREQGQAYWPDNAPRVEDLPDLRPEIEGVFAAFMDGSLNAVAPTLEAFIAQTPEEMLPTVGDPLYLLAHAIDVSYLAAARAHMFSLPETLGGEERVRRLDLASQFASVFAGALVPDDTGEVNGSPSMEEYQLYRCLGSMAVQASVAEARTIWQPILAAGTPARSWVSAFISEVWTTALTHESPPPQFAELFREILAFAANQETWTGWETDELQLDLLCLSRYGYPRMEERHRELLAALQPEWAELVHEHMQSSYWPVASSASSAGRSPPISSIPAFSGAEREREGASTDEDVDQATAEMLAEMIGRDPQLVRRSADAATVLAALVARQNAMALQISAVVGGNA